MMKTFVVLALIAISTPTLAQGWPDNDQRGFPLRTQPLTPEETSRRVIENAQHPYQYNPPPRTTYCRYVNGNMVCQ